MTIDEQQYYYVPKKVNKIYLSIFPHHTPSYMEGDQVVADTLTFRFHTTSTYIMLPLITRCHQTKSHLYIL